MQGGAFFNELCNIVTLAYKSDWNQCADVGRRMSIFTVIIRSPDI